jgi:Zn-dependent peptidase ImmA (M78 family)
MRGVAQAWKAAEKVLKDHGVRRTPINVARIASKHASVVKRALEDDISGALIPLGENEWAILVNSQHHPNRQRFTIAHELGHLLLHGYRTPHADKQFRLRDARSSEGSVLEEIQANQFAAELLMPRAMIMKAIEHHGFQHAPANELLEEEQFETLVNKLAKDFGVSRQAMTIRLSSLVA